MMDDELLGVELIREMSRESLIREITVRQTAWLKRRLAESSDKALKMEVINLRAKAYQERIVAEAGWTVDECGMVVEGE